MLNPREEMRRGRRVGFPVAERMMSDATLIRLLTHRGYEVSSPEPVEGPSRLQRDVSEFLNTDRWMEAPEQLALMGRVLCSFDQTIPALSAKQHDKLEERLDEHPAWRVVPARLSAVHKRKAQTQRLAGSELASVLPAEDQLWTPADNKNDHSMIWSTLWSEKGGPVLYNGRIFEPRNDKLKLTNPALKSYELRYRTLDGRFVDRAEYIGNLLINGQAVRAEDGSTWIFPVMDVSDRRPITTYSELARPVEKLHAQTSAFVSPEALVNLQLLHLITGRPKDEDVVDISNEVVSEIDRHGVHKKVEGVAAVTWSKDLNRIRLLWENGLSKTGDFQVVEAVSGLGYEEDLLQEAA